MTQKEKVMDWIAAHGAVHTNGMADELNIKRTSVHSYISKMIKSGELVRNPDRTVSIPGSTGYKMALEFASCRGMFSGFPVSMDFVEGR